MRCFDVLFAVSSKSSWANIRVANNFKRHDARYVNPYPYVWVEDNQLIQLQYTYMMKLYADQ